MEQVHFDADPAIHRTILHLLERARPYLAEALPGRVLLNQDGMINDVLVVDEQRVFRFPKDERGKAVLTREVAVLDFVRRHVSIPVPDLVLHDEGFVSYPFIPGVPLEQDTLQRQDEATQERLAEALGTFLRQLHGIPRDAVESHGIAAGGSARTCADWLDLYRATESELFPLLMANQRAWVHRLFAPVVDGSLDLVYLPALVHGDLGSYHILCDLTAGSINGVIDFGTAGLGDPADDFANVINALGVPFLRRMARYHPGIEPALDRARFWAASLELQWALGGLRSGDHSWFTVHLGRARAT